MIYVFSSPENCSISIQNEVQNWDHNTVYFYHEKLEPIYFPHVTASFLGYLNRTDCFSESM